MNNKISIVKKYRTQIIFVCMLILILSTVYTSYYPKSALGKIVIYYNSISSLIVMLLTLVYVITTNLQLNTMGKQLNLMRDSVNLQVQPLPIPKLEKVYLEKIRGFVGPEDNFGSIHFLSRFHCDISFENVGNSPALNILIHSGLYSEKGELVSSLSKRELYCLSEKKLDDKKISMMLLDENNEILKQLVNGNLILKLDIYYKNIFGAGFYEKAEYELNSDDNHARKWLEFLKQGFHKYDLDIKRFSALSNSVPEDADEIFSRIAKEMENEYKDDLTLEHWTNSSSYNLELIDFEDSTNKANNRLRERNEKLFNIQKAKDEAAATKLK